MFNCKGEKILFLLERKKTTREKGRGSYGKQSFQGKCKCIFTKVHSLIKQNSLEKTKQKTSQTAMYLAWLGDIDQKLFKPQFSF